MPIKPIVNNPHLPFKRGLWAPLLALLVMVACSPDGAVSSAPAPFTDGDDERVEAADGDLDLPESDADPFEIADFEIADKISGGDSDEDPAEYGDLETVEFPPEDAVCQRWKRSFDFPLTTEDLDAPTVPCMDLPEPRASQWFYDFPDVPPGANWEQVAVLDNGIPMIAMDKYTLFPPSQKPTTYLPIARSYSYIFLNDGTIIAADYTSTKFVAGAFVRFDPEIKEWEVIYDQDDRYFSILAKDSEDTVWFNTPYALDYNHRYRNGKIETFSLTPECKYSRFGILGGVNRCGNHTYLFGYAMGGEIPIPAIFLFDEERHAARPVWTGPKNHSYILSKSVNPDTCEFLAAGYSFYVGGVLGDPIDVTYYSGATTPEETNDLEFYESHPWIIFKDWESGRIIAAEDAWLNDDGVSVNRPMFVEVTIGEDISLRPIPPDKYPGKYKNWIPREIGGSYPDNLFVAGTNFAYRYNPQADRMELVDTQPMIRDLWTFETTSHRDLSVTGNSENMRILATGYRLPVMNRAACKDWKEAFPGSEWVLDVYDDSERVVMVGEDPDILEISKTGSRFLRGPRPKWVRGMRVVTDAEGYLHAIGCMDYDCRDMRLFSTRRPIDDSPCALSWREMPYDQLRWIEGDFQIMLNPQEFVMYDGRLFLSLERAANGPREGFDSMGLFEIESEGYDTGGKLFRARLIHIDDAEGHLEANEEMLWYTAMQRAYRIDPDSGETQTLIDVSHLFNGTLKIRRAIPLDDHRWLVSYHDLIGEYDTNTGSMDRYWASVGWDSVSPDESYGWPTYFLLKGRNYTRLLAKLPTGEMISAGTEGQIVTRSPDHLYFRK